MLSFLILVISFMGKCIYANDKCYATERLRIESEARTERKEIVQNFGNKLDKIIDNQNTQNSRLTRIETKLERVR